MEPISCFKTSEALILQWFPSIPLWLTLTHFFPLSPQQALLKAPILHLTDLTCPCSLYVTEKEGFALGVLGRQLGPSFAPVAYLSKKKTNKQKTKKQKKKPN
jgi:hypothetical protein